MLSIIGHLWLFPRVRRESVDRNGWARWVLRQGSPIPVRTNFRVGDFSVRSSVVQRLQCGCRLVSQQAAVASVDSSTSRPRSLITSAAPASAVICEQRRLRFPYAVVAIVDSSFPLLRPQFANERTRAQGFVACIILNTDTLPIPVDQGCAIGYDGKG
jgi:hypothetical protein